jgi:hypothetical protein
MMCYGFDVTASVTHLLQVLSCQHCAYNDHHLRDVYLGSTLSEATKISHLSVGTQQGRNRHQVRNMRNAERVQCLAHDP